MQSGTTNTFAEATDFFPGLDDYNVGTEEYLDNIYRAKQRANIPIIGSLNGITHEGWIDYSRLIEQAGADAIEVNIFFIPADITMSSSEVEHRYLNIIESIKLAVDIPVAVKLNPYFSATGNMAMRMKNSGADALVLFNRFYQPDIDIVTLRLRMDLDLSSDHCVSSPVRCSTGTTCEEPADADGADDDGEGDEGDRVS